MSVSEISSARTNHDQQADAAANQGETPIVVDASFALGYYNNGMAAYDELLYGEKYAKIAMLIGSLIRRPVLLSGIPASGKSTFIHEAHRAYSDMSADDVVRISGQSDATPRELIGGTHVSQIEADGRVQTKTTNYAGLILPTTRALVLEELSRNNPETNNSLLPVLESRRLEVDGKHILIPKMDFVIAALNASESRQATFPLSDAMISRFTLGAIMGRKSADAHTRRDDLAKILEHRAKHSPENIRPFTSHAGQEALRAYVLATQLSKRTMTNIIDTSIKMNQVFEGVGIEEADTRIPIHLVEMAQALGSIRNEEHIVKDEDVADSAHMVMEARLGSKKKTSQMDVPAMIDQVINF
jgi:MoxR-like ATPase